MVDKDEQEVSDQKINWKWQSYDTLIFGDSGTSPCEKICSFDMDWTIIRTKTGKVFPKDENDWVLWDEKVKATIQKYQKDGFKIVIFTNQGGITTHKTTAQAIKTKIQNISNEIGVQM